MTGLMVAKWVCFTRNRFSKRRLHPYLAFRLGLSREIKELSSSFNNQHSRLFSSSQIPARTLSAFNTKYSVGHRDSDLQLSAYLLSR